MPSITYLCKGCTACISLSEGFVTLLRLTILFSFLHMYTLTILWFYFFISVYITIIRTFFGRKFWGPFQKDMKITLHQDSLAC